MASSVAVMMAALAAYELLAAARIVLRWVGKDGSMDHFLARAPLTEVLRTQAHAQLSYLLLMMATICSVLVQK